MEIGAAVSEVILEKIRKVFDLNKGDDEVFRTKNGAPKIMTKFKDKPYSYELLPEYANGSKKFPTVNSMNWEGKTATAKVIRGFTSSTLVVQCCPNPRSWLPGHGTAYAVPQYPCSTRFFFLAPSDEKTVIG